MERVLVIETRYHRPFSTAEKDLMLTDWDEILTQMGAEAFDRALDSCSKNEEFFSLPKLREYAGMKKRDLEDAEANEAWAWINEKLAIFGHEWKHKRLPAPLKKEPCEQCKDTGWVVKRVGTLGSRQEKASRCECSVGKLQLAPEIPVRVQYCLCQLARTVHEGLARIAKTPESKVNFVRKEFVEAYKLAIFAQAVRPQLRMGFEPKSLPRPESDLDRAGSSLA